MAKGKNSFQRAAGILLPITCLPSPYGIGTLGAQAYKFIDFLKASGQKYWQVLPVGPTSYGDSPYQSFSAFAGNPYLIDLDILCDEGLLDRKYLEKQDWGEGAYIDYEKIYKLRFSVLKKAYQKSGHKELDDYNSFCEKNSIWLDDYALYMSLKNYFGGVAWLEWDDDIRVRKPAAVKKYSKQFAEEMDFWRFVQYKFFEQWSALKTYAGKNGVEFIGDIPIYVAMDCADVWANPEQYQMDNDCRPVKVAGVPPDYFCEDGQLWGNPLYNWTAMKKDNYSWWRRRMKFASEIYDVIRIDHFIGIVRYYSIDAGAPNAKSGEWCKGPGMELIDAINESRGKTRMIAEDLGEVVAEVRKVQIKSGYPGMKVLQFAFDGAPDNHFLPHNHSENFIVYTGTHDNDTTRGMVESLPTRKWKYAREYLNVRRTADIPDAMIRAAMSSVAHTAIIPVQDWLGIGSEGRINTPATLGNNWHWRMPQGLLTEELAAKIYDLTYNYGRIS